MAELVLRTANNGLRTVVNINASLGLTRERNEEKGKCSVRCNNPINIFFLFLLERIYAKDLNLHVLSRTKEILLSCVCQMLAHAEISDIVFYPSFLY